MLRRRQALDAHKKITFAHARTLQIFIQVDGYWNSQKTFSYRLYIGKCLNLTSIFAFQQANFTESFSPTISRLFHKLLWIRFPIQSPLSAILPDFDRSSKPAKMLRKGVLLVIKRHSAFPPKRILLSDTPHLMITHIQKLWFLLKKTNWAFIYICVAANVLSGKYYQRHLLWIHFFNQLFQIMN